MLVIYIIIIYIISLITIFLIYNKILFQRSRVVQGKNYNIEKYFIIALSMHIIHPLMTDNNMNKLIIIIKIFPPTFLS